MSPEHESNAQFHVKYFPPIEKSYKNINVAVKYKTQYAPY